MIRLFFISFLLFFQSNLLHNHITIDHEYYVSLTEITYKKEDKKVEIIMRLFHDDFEKVLKERYSEDLELKPKHSSENIEDYIQLYISKKINLSINQESKKLNYLGYKFDEDRINIYLKISGVHSFDEVNIKNLLMTDLFEEQKNIVHCFKLKQKKSVLLTRFDSEAMLKFN